ncbi:hypothetical protein Gasu2_49000 [Galdieria sulphuraria]|nr:hypothetical protein Gasu2_49000 [Galdieria sulphuraria]
MPKVTESQHSLIGSAPLLPLLPEQKYKEHKSDILEEEEVFNLLQAFRKYFPEPPSNLKAQQIIESMSGAVFTEQEELELWKKNLQPWSSRWYSKKDSFLKDARARFRRSSDIQFITKELAEEWAKCFFHSKDCVADKVV